jgi:hypothetical protein
MRSAKCLAGRPGRVVQQGRRNQPIGDDATAQEPVLRNREAVAGGQRERVTRGAPNVQNHCRINALRARLRKDIKSLPTPERTLCVLHNAQTTWA